MLRKSSLIATLLACSTGCSQAITDDFFAPTFGDAQRFTQQLSTQQQLHDDNMTKQHQAMSPQTSNAIVALKTDVDKQIAQLQEQTAAMHSAVGENVDALTQLTTRFLGIPIGLPLTKLFDDTSIAIAQVDNQAKENIDLLSTSVIRQLDVHDDELQTVVSNEKLADKFTNDKIMSLRIAIQESRDKIQEVITNPNKLRSTILTVARQAGITSEAIATLESANDQDFMELILTLLGGGLLGGAASRLGPSRSQKETDLLRQKIDRLNETATPK